MFSSWDGYLDVFSCVLMAKLDGRGIELSSAGIKGRPRKGAELLRVGVRVAGK